ncbi:hypothetical protein AWC38_SpisGene21385 [Stylophora pistillata]|uniref:Uncharacterized protein n=1 Tax=Stylophora pistillata TaxID=50429 RepID=A0A2B4R9Y6_STYPI|nr:hypothetical protein AWC38_SpisGene21385 [Stylophora pistillata]
MSRGICTAQDRLDRFSHIALATNWIVKKIEEDMETLRIELAQKNMQIQSLQSDLYKLKEKYDNETKSLRSEVERGREKVGSLKVEIRRGQPVASNEKENGEIGVVSNVAILETETQTLKENVKKKIEKEKSTLSLLNKEAGNKVAQLCSANNALKTARKKLMEEIQKLKKVQESSRAKEDSGRRLPGEALLAAKRKRVKPEPKENFQNWLSGDGANYMFKDEPNECANQ